MSDAKQNENIDRPAYEAPKLTDHGAVSEMTKTNTTFTGTSDGGSFPNMYAS